VADHLLGWANGAPLIAETVVSARLTVTPLRVEDADEIAPLLDDATLHAYTEGLRQPWTSCANAIGGRSSGTRRTAHNAGSTGSSANGNRLPQPARFIRSARCKQPFSTRPRVVAEVAWVIATTYQGKGFATEASQAMVAWLRANGVDRVVAHIHPHHEASIAVARSLGLHPTDTVLNGETRWEGT
jgi:hypothetical protein